MNLITKFSVIFSLSAISQSGFAQIPNPGFETWTNMGSYMNPNGWDNTNAMTNAMSIYTCTQGSPGNPGSYYLKLTSHTVGTMGVVPGVAMSGVMNTTTFRPKSGFAYTSQPVSLTGNMQYMAYGTGQGFIDIYLTKWNTSMNRRDTVAKGHKGLPTMQMSWIGFTVNLSYLSITPPDSATVFLSSSGFTGAADNDFLYVDNLAFSGNAAGIQEMNDNKLLMVYPNPANDMLHIRLVNSVQSIQKIEIYSITGELVMMTNEKMISAESSVDVTGLGKGLYILKLSSSEGVLCKRFVKQ